MSRTPPIKLPPLSISELYALPTEDERERVVAQRKRAIFNIPSTCVKCIEHFTPSSHKGAKMFVFVVGETGEHIYYNVDRAYAIAKRDNVPEDYISLADMDRALRNTDFDIAHLYHIPPEAITRPVMFAAIPGQGTHTIIDGSHRMKILRTIGVRATMYVLSDSQSQEALFTTQDWEQGRTVLKNLGITFD